ncbi:MAG: NUDIX domain-containing protein [Bacteroidales bacterium]|nr:NUDIX domain-containing protein [Bacteroidales bacterium]MDD3989804.1 NUDIX domain-containing protein [Bacteroidales bacterium]MDD4639484.1 NUDIX domain-containing protein [Bacteroidales bacterium]
MYSIYFNTRCLAVCNPDDVRLKDPEAVIHMPVTEQNDISTLPQFFNQSQNIHKLFIPTSTPVEVFANLCSGMKKITAGGGLVTNSKGYILMIFRHGVWDLPKGKQEDSEECDQAAIREVEEECGVHELAIKNFICTTYHSYTLDGEMVLKQTNWYRMNYNGNGDSTTPQKEEDIERAIWVKPQELDYFLEKSYPSIRAVFARAVI